MNGPGIGSAGALMWQRDSGLLVGPVSLFFSFLVSFGDVLVVGEVRICWANGLIVGSLEQFVKTTRE